MEHTNPVIVRHIPRPETGILNALLTSGVATVHEALGRTGLMNPYLRPLYQRVAVAGPAVTISCHPGDNLMLHAALDICEPGDVLVVAPVVESSHGMFGALLGTCCQTLGIAGLIIDAGVRDASDLIDMRFPVWAKLVCAQGTTKNASGSVNLPLTCAGELVFSGDIIVADFDGVVVVPAAAAADVAQAALSRHAREQEDRQRLVAGELTMDVYGFRDKLREVGVTYVDELPE